MHRITVGRAARPVGRIAVVEVAADDRDFVSRRPPDRLAGTATAGGQKQDSSKQGHSDHPAMLIRFAPTVTPHLGKAGGNAQGFADAFPSDG